MQNIVVDRSILIVFTQSVAQGNCLPLRFLKVDLPAKLPYNQGSLAGLAAPLLKRWVAEIRETMNTKEKVLLTEEQETMLVSLSTEITIGAISEAVLNLPTEN